MQPFVTFGADSRPCLSWSRGALGRLVQHPSGNASESREGQAGWLVRFFPETALRRDIFADRKAEQIAFSTGGERASPPVPRKSKTKPLLPAAPPSGVAPETKGDQGCKRRRPSRFYCRRSGKKKHCPTCPSAGIPLFATLSASSCFSLSHTATHPSFFPIQVVPPTWQSIPSDTASLYFVSGSVKSKVGLI